MKCPALRRTLRAGAVMIVISLAGAGPLGAAESYTFSGRGTAHGVGLDMAGAQALASQGRGYRDILKTYYSGVDIAGGEAGHWLRVGILNSGDIRVTADKPYFVYANNASPGSHTVRVPAGTVTHVVHGSGRYVTSVEGGGSWTATNHTWFAPEAGGHMKVLNNGRRYRGYIEARFSSSNFLWAINVINIEDYVKGIAEEPNSWPREGQRTLAVAARTYALNKKFYNTRWDSENFDIDATMGSQYYLGFDAERSNLVAATDYTKGQVVKYGGKIILAAYHGNSGGHTESLANVWGGSPGSYPYLRAVPSPWTPVYSWGPKTFSRAQLEQIFNSRPSASVGTLYSIDFSDRTASGRLRKVRLNGSAGTKEVWGYSEFAAWLGFPSSMIKVGNVARDIDKWDSFILLGNLTKKAAKVKVIFFFPAGKKKAIAVKVPAFGRATLAVDGKIKTGPFSAKIESDRLVVAERVNYFTYNGLDGGHSSLGVKEPSRRWYVAGGRTGPKYDTSIAILNPGTVEAKVTAVFMPVRGPKVKKTITIRPQARKAIFVEGSVKKATRVPAIIRSTRPVVVERATYVDKDGYEGGHATKATSVLSKHWYFAEGHNNKNYRTRLEVFNPGRHRAMITVGLKKSNGRTVRRRFTVPRRSQKSIQLDTMIAAQAFAIKVTANRNVAAERTLYFKDGKSIGAHASVGSPVLSRRRYFAEGYTGGGFTQFISVLNQRPRWATVEIEYLSDGGGVMKTTRHRVRPGSRYTVRANDAAEAGSGKAFATRIKSDRSIMAERVTYFRYRGKDVLRRGGNSTLGAATPAKIWYFAEGRTD